MEARCGRKGGIKSVFLILLVAALAVWVTRPETLWAQKEWVQTFLYGDLWEGLSCQAVLVGGLR